MCWPAEPSRARTASGYLYWVANSCQSVLPVWRTSFSCLADLVLSRGDPSWYKGPPCLM